MLLKPDLEDVRGICYGLGKVLLVVAAAGVLPLGWAVWRSEWAAAGSIVLMAGVAAVLAGLGELCRPAGRRHRGDWSNGMVVVALTWLIVPAIAAIPLWSSGHYGDPLDAFFDAMSGVTTTGFTVVQDLDHMPESVTVWRITLQLLGGQGIVLAALTFFAAGGSPALYRGEARDERIFPSVGSTARFIWLVTLYHGVAALIVLGSVMIGLLGFRPDRALFHAYSIFVAAFDTGGFVTQSGNLAYYHSPTVEAVAMVLMVAGAMSFGLHYALVQRRPGLHRDLEVRTILLSFAGTLVAVTAGLAALGLFDDTAALARFALFHTVSAHTGTGFTLVSSNDLARWSGWAYAGLSVAMALGGMASSTSGGVKSIRVGLTVKAIVDSVREALLPEHAVLSRSYWQAGRQRLGAELAQAVMAISLLYVGLHLLGAAFGLAHGFPLSESLFESVSAGANAGLSVGITGPEMPAFLQTVMILQMWVGRLEFIAVFALVGFAISWVLGE